MAKFVKITAGLEGNVEIIDMCSLDDLKVHLGGNFKAIKVIGYVIAFNEEALLDDSLEDNHPASSLGMGVPGLSAIKGDVVIVDTALKGDFRGLSTSDAKWIANMSTGLLKQLNVNHDAGLEISY